MEEEKLDVKEVLKFHQMITPIVIQVVFWLGILGILITFLATVGQQVVPAIVLLIFGPLFWRMYCEIFIVIFRINENLVVIRKGGKGFAKPVEPEEEPPPPPAE